MRKFISVTFIVIALFASTTLAATENLKYGVEAGVNFSRIKSYDFQTITAFRVGAHANYKLPSASIHNNLYFSTGLYLVKKGAKSTDYIETHIDAYYIEIPIHMGFKQHLSSDFSLFEEIGPYAAIGTFGKIEKADYTDDAGVFFKGGEEATFDHLKRLDAGIGLKIGIVYNDMLQLTAGVDWGVMKTTKSSEFINLSKGQNFSSYMAIGLIF